MSNSTNARLKWVITCLLATVCLLASLCTAGGLWVATRSTPPPTPTPTLLHTPTPTISPTPDPETTACHLRVFTELWEIVRDDYLYPDHNGADWDAIGQEYRARVQAGLSDERFWLAMDEMLLELNDDHSIFLPPAVAADEELMRSGKLEYVGIGVYTAALPEKEYSVVLLVLPDSPADRAGILPHDRILAVDGLPACCDEFGYDYLYRLLGSEGSQVKLRVQSPGASPRTVTATRARILESLPVETHRLDGNVGYVLIPSFWDETVVERVHQALEELAAEGELAGLVLDLRVNAGGSDSVLEGVLAFFGDGTLGHFVGRGWEEPLRVEGIDVHGSQHVELVILVGRETVSFAEIFSGVLQETGRARIVGRTTPGNVEILYSYDFEDRSRAWIAQEMFRPLSESDWEETGIIPDVEIPLNWDEFTAEDDPQLEAALDMLRR